MSFGKISSEIRAEGDTICKELALPNTTSKYTDAFTNAGVMTGGEIVIAAAGSISITASKKLTLEFADCTTAGGTYTVTAQIAAFTGAKTFAAGDEIARFVPTSKVKAFQKIKLTADEDLSAAKINAWIVHKG